MEYVNLNRIKTSFVKAKNHHQGIACLASIIRYYGGDIDLDSLNKESGASLDHVSLLGLCKAAQKKHFDANGYKGNISYLKDVKEPQILFVDKGDGKEDFVLVYGWYSNRFIVGDPMNGINELREDELDAIWKSKAFISIKPTPEFYKSGEEKPLKFKFLKQFLFKQKRIFTWQIIMTFICLLYIILLKPFFIRLITDFAQIQEQQISLKTGLYLLILVIVFIILMLVKNVIEIYASKACKSELSQLIARYFVNSNLFNREKTGKISGLLSVAQEMSEKGRKLFNRVFFFIPLIIASIYFVFWESVLLGISLLLVLGFTVIFVAIRQKKSGHVFISQYQAITERAEILINGSTMLNEIQNLNKQDQFMDTQTRSFDFVYEVEFYRIKQNLKYGAFIAVLEVILVVGICCYINLENYILNPEKVVNLIFIIVLFLWGLLNSGKLVRDFFICKWSYNLLYAGCLRHLTEESGANNNVKSHESVNRLKIENLSYAFPGKLPVIKSFSIKLHKGMIGLVIGNSGLGKTVMVDILSRHLPLQQGNIVLNKLNFTDLTDSQWRSMVSTLKHDNKLPAFSVLQAFMWVVPDRNQEEVLRFCKEMGLNSFFDRLSSGFATKIDTLSSGEHQLLSFALALYINPQVLVLDEPFAMMDITTTEICQKILEKQKEQRITLLFSYDESLCNLADKVVMLEGNETIHSKNKHIKNDYK